MSCSKAFDVWKNFYPEKRPSYKTQSKTCFAMTDEEDITTYGTKKSYKTVEHHAKLKVTKIWNTRKAMTVTATTTFVQSLLDSDGCSVFDIEGNALLDDVTTVHCVVWTGPNAGEVHVTGTPRRPWSVSVNTTSSSATTSPATTSPRCISWATSPVARTSSSSTP